MTGFSAPTSCGTATATIRDLFDAPPTCTETVPTPKELPLFLAGECTGHLTVKAIIEPLVECLPLPPLEQDKPPRVALMGARDNDKARMHSDSSDSENGKSPMMTV